MVLLLIPLLLIPGALIMRALGDASEASTPLDRAYERIVISALLNGWLALTLAELGIFAIWLHLLILLVACLAAAFYAYRQGTLRLPNPPLGFAAANVRPAITLGTLHHSIRQNLEILAFAVIGFAFLLIVARPFEVVLGVRDAGVYATTGFAIARSGAIVQSDPLVAQIGTDKSSGDPAILAAAAQAETNFLGVQPPQRTIATRLRMIGFFINQGDLETGRVVPQFFHLYPAWIALLASLAGFHAGLLATGLMGFLGVWSVGMLGRRLAGPWVGMIAALLLALNGVQAWFSRYSTSETTAQFLLFAGLYFFAKAIQYKNTQSVHFPALLAGIALGQLALTRIDFLLALAPVLAYLLYSWLTRRWYSIHSWLAIGLGALLIHAALHIVLIARAYFFDTLFARLQDYALTALVSMPFLTPALRQVYLLRPCSPVAIQPCPPVAGMPPTVFTEWNYPRIFAECAILVLAIIALLAFRRWGQPAIATAERIIQRYSRPLLNTIALALTLFSAYAYLVRPQILTIETLQNIPACLAPIQLRNPQGACLALQGYVGAPIAPPRYPDPIMLGMATLEARLRGKPAPSPQACDALLAGDQAAGLQLNTEAAQLNYQDDQTPLRRACVNLRLRDLFANSQANLVRIGWYLSPLGMILGLAGLALWWRYGLRAESWLFLAITTIAGVVFIRITYGASDQTFIYILRRYIPHLYPALALGIAYALAALAGVLPGTLQPVWAANSARWLPIRRILAATLGLALTLFLAITNLPLYRHVEYGGALDQIEQIAQKFEPRDVLLLRGGAPTYADARDIPDLLATPLKYAFGVNAFSIKSARPEYYAADLARYIARWRSEGREVYLAIGPSGAVGLPGFTLEPAGAAHLHLREFEQLERQKPSNIQDFDLDFAIYRLVPATQLPPIQPIAPDTYAAQIRGFYRAETINGIQLAWTDGDALLRLPLPVKTPQDIRIQLAPGPRPATKSPAQVCISLAIEPPPGTNLPPPANQHCLALTPSMAEYTITVDPGMASLPPGKTLLVRISSDTWIPARDDPDQHDLRKLGIQFGGLTVSP